MLSCLTKRAWLGLEATAFGDDSLGFFFFCLSGLSELDSIQSLPDCQHWTQTFPVFRTNVVISFQVQHLKDYFSLLLSSPHQTCLSFSWRDDTGTGEGGFGFLAHLLRCLSVEMPAWEFAVMLVLGCGLQQNWNGCFPSASEQLSEATNASIQQQEPVFCCVYVFVLCMCNFWTAPVLGSSSSLC